MNYIGIDIGGTKCSVSKITISESRVYNILDNYIFTAYPKHEEYIQAIMNSIKRLDLTDVEAIGISCGGPLDTKSGVVQNPPNLPDWNNIPIVELIENQFKLPVFLKNDANAGALAEWIFGNYFEKNNVIFCTFGTGMGAGLILNGELYEGSNGNAGEIGHIRLSENGPLGYGKNGSFEGFASGGGLLNFSQNYFNKPISAKELFELYDKGNKPAEEMIKVSMEKLGLGLSILIDILNPEVIILGSMYHRQKETIDKYMLTELGKETLPNSFSVCDIVPTSLADNIGDLAAVSVAYYELEIKGTRG